ncbi:MAG: hypothetical protein LUI61_01720 [Firmicutes bacterium]|nr:hypothetical protein [Bacillota bacterium]
MSRYKIISMAASAVAAVVCIFAYVRGSDYYGIALILGAAACAVITVCEWCERRRVAKATGAGGVTNALSYITPLLSTVVTVVVIIAAVWYFAG